jgi:hypothetical protein
MDYSGIFALTVASTAGKVLEDATRVKEAAHTFDRWCFGIEHSAV